MTTTSLPEGASFLVGDPEAIFTPERFSSDDRMMVQTAERFCRERVLPNLERLEKQEEGLMSDLIREAGELGLCGVDSPEAYGGLGMGKNLAARILEFMSLDGAFSVTYGITSGISQVG
ncbi:acyl-CoA dehydrogenase, partial [bacterium]